MLKAIKGRVIVVCNC